MLRHKAKLPLHNCNPMATREESKTYFSSTLSTGANQCSYEQLYYNVEADVRLTPTLTLKTLLEPEDVLPQTTGN